MMHISWKAKREAPTNLLPSKVAFNVQFSGYLHLRSSWEAARGDLSLRLRSDFLVTWKISAWATSQLRGCARDKRRPDEQEQQTIHGDPRQYPEDDR